MPDRTTSHQHTHLPSCCRLRRHARNAQLPPLTSSRPSFPPLLPAPTSPPVLHCALPPYLFPSWPPRGRRGDRRCRAASTLRARPAHGEASRVCSESAGRALDERSTRMAARCADRSEWRAPQQPPNRRHKWRRAAPGGARSGADSEGPRGRHCGIT